MVPIREHFDGYQPPGWFTPTVERLLGSLSPSHVQGLSAIVLTHAAASPRLTRSRASRRQRHGVPLGRYHPARRGQLAYIELVVDTIVEPMPAGVRWLGLIRDVVVARTLYHEIGHHLHETIGSASRGGERSAEAWRQQLTKIHLRKRYWYLRPFAGSMAAVLRAIVTLRTSARGAR